MEGVYYGPKKSRFGLIPIGENEIVDYYTKDGKGCVVGYSLYNQKGLTTQIGKRVDVLSSNLTAQKKNIGNVSITDCKLEFTETTIPVIETLEILENYRSIEDLNKVKFAAYMRNFALAYSDSAAVYVLRNRKYQESTIAFLESFLEYFGVENTLRQFLPAHPEYTSPTIKEFYKFGETHGKMY